MPETGHPRAQRALRLFFAPSTVAVVALLVYGTTLAPGLTWANHGADGGDLLAAALTGGVPHPTGYPTYQLLLRLAISLAPGNPAATGAWLSAICAAVAVGLLADLSRRVLERSRDGSGTVSRAAAAIGALAWAVSPLLWGQATIVEVYALHALFCIALLWGTQLWLEAVEPREGRWWALVTGLVLGVGLGNHLTIALMLPGVVTLGWSRRHEPKPALSRELALACAGTLAGLLVYLYLPMAASQHSPINWGDPTTPPALLSVATGRLYASLPFGLSLSQLGNRLVALATLIVWQLLPWGFVLALAGLWRLDRRLHRWWLATLLIFLAYGVYAAGYATSDSLIYLIPAFAMVAMWLEEGLAWGFDALRKRPALLGAAVLVALAALPLVSLARNWREQDLSQETKAADFARLAVADAQPDAVILVAGDEKTFALWYQIYGLHQRRDVAVLNVNLYGFEWYRRSLAETHPTLLPSVDTPMPVHDLIKLIIKARPVYVAEDVGLPLALREEAGSGVLTRVLASRE